MQYSAGGFSCLALANHTGAPLLLYIVQLSAHVTADCEFGNGHLDRSGEHPPDQTKRGQTGTFIFSIKERM